MNKIDIFQEMGNKPMTVREVAEYLTVSTDLIYKMVNSGEIPHIRIGERIIRFFPQAINDWINSQSSQCL
jgi:excisionase family DNA binding protein